MCSSALTAAGTVAQSTYISPIFIEKAPKGGTTIVSLSTINGHLTAAQQLLIYRPGSNSKIFSVSDTTSRQALLTASLY